MGSTYGANLCLIFIYKQVAPTAHLSVFQKLVSILDSRFLTLFIKSPPSHKYKWAQYQMT
jgi:hypothetical protein